MVTSVLVERSPRGGCTMHEFDFSTFVPPNGRVSIQRSTTVSSVTAKPGEKPDSIHTIQCMTFSRDGAFFAFCDKNATKIVDANTRMVLHSLPITRTAEMVFSPDNHLLVTWEPYVKYATDQSTSDKPEPNQRYWNVTTGELVKKAIVRNRRDWSPQWTANGHFVVNTAGSEILVADRDMTPHSKFVVNNVKSVSLSPTPGDTCFIATATPCKASDPGYIRLHLVDHDSFPPVATKTFVQADSVEFMWNPSGTNVLAIASQEVDATNQSYYGAQKMFLLSTRGETYKVALDKQGPVHSVDWHPKGHQFAVIYGYMPAKACVFDLEAQPVYDMAEGPRNGCKFNATGDLLLLTGFGNLSGNMELWTHDGTKGRLVCKMKVPDTTQCLWAPDAQHIVTATCTPRLRLNNGYRIWRYTGECVFEFMVPDRPGNQPGAPPVAGELWSVDWRPDARAAVPFTPVFLTKQQRDNAGMDSTGKACGTQQEGNAAAPNGVHPADALGDAVSAKGAYVPPHLRNKMGGAKPTPAKPSGPRVEKSEAEKKIDKLEKRVKDIEKLIIKQKKGDKLEANQLEKVDKIDEVRAELAALKAQ